MVSFWLVLEWILKTQLNIYEYMILHSNKNLVMHFRKTVYISWFHDAELWEWLGAGPHNFRRGCFSNVPEPNYSNFQQKISMKSFKNDFLNFRVKVSHWICVLCYKTGRILILWHFIYYTQNSASFPHLIT